jgi:large subunit ribosomal protein L30
MASELELTVTQTRSGIGTKPKHRGTLRALGLHGIGTSNTLPDRPEIRGMIARVPHLIRVEEGAAVAPPKAVAQPAVAETAVAVAAPAQTDPTDAEPAVADPEPDGTEES